MKDAYRRGRHARIALALALAIAAVVLPGTAQAAETLDQQQPTDNGGYLGITSARSGGQTFTAGITGSLTRVSLSLGQGYATGDLSVQIYDTSGGLPTGGALATTTIPRASVGAWDSRSWVDASFASPAAITTGHQYAIVVRYTTGSGYYALGTTNTNPYAGGTAMFDVGQGWVQATDYDVAFKTYVEPVPVAAQFVDPLAQSTADGTTINTAKNGRVVPVKVQLEQGGTALTADNAPGPVTLSVTRLGPCASGGSTDPVDVYAAGGSSSGSEFRYDAASAAWVYNLDTRAMGLTSGDCYRLDVVVNGLRAENAWAILEPVR